MIIILVAVIVLTVALTAWALLMDWLDSAQKVIHLTETEAAEQRERLILAVIAWDTLHHPVEEPAYTREHLEGGA